MTAKSLWAIVCAVVCLALTAASAGADTLPAGARSASSAILGAEAYCCGALPPPGFHLLDYNLYYYADDLKGQDGGNVNGAPFTDFEASALATVIRPIYVSDKTLFGANMAWHAVIPIIHKNQNSDFFDDNMDGFGDIYVSPLILGWHNPPWHWVVGLDVIAPTGKYSDSDVTTIGNHHWTFEPALAISYMGDNGIHADVKLMYDFHTRDSTLDYREAQQLHLDYNVGLMLGSEKEWKVGLCGYYLASMDEDKGPAGHIDDSEEEVFAIGPSIMYTKGKFFAEAKVQFEMEAQNRPEGTSAWLKIGYSF